MEILKSGDVPALVTNIEVMNILSENIQRRVEAEKEKAEREGLAPDETTEGQEISGGVRRRVDRRQLKLRHRNHVEDTVHEYLKYSACAEVDSDRMPELVARLQQNDSNATTISVGGGVDSDIGGFGLMDAETLQVLNLMPKEPVELHLIVEDLMGRMDEDRQRELLDLLPQYRTSSVDEMLESKEIADLEGETVGDDDEEIVGNIE